MREGLGEGDGIGGSGGVWGGGWRVADGGCVMEGYRVHPATSLAFTNFAFYFLSFGDSEEVFQRALLDSGVEVNELLDIDNVLENCDNEFFIKRIDGESGERRGGEKEREARRRRRRRRREEKTGGKEKGGEWGEEVKEKMKAKKKKKGSGG